MPTIEFLYPSLGAMLDTIDATRQGGGWQDYGDPHGSLTSWAELPSLAEAVAMGRTGTGLDATSATIAQLADALLSELPMPESVRRVPTWGRKGQSLRVTKVLGGHLNTAWRTTTQQRRPANGRILTLLLPVSFSVTISATTLSLTIAASCAYALLAERAGYRTELYACGGSTRSYRNGTDTLILTQLKAAQSPWNIHSIALAAHPVFLRRLCLRIAEQSMPQYGPLRGGYGWPHTQTELRATISAWAQGQGIASETVAYGAGEEDHLTTPARAKAWVAAAVTTLE